MCLLRGTDWTFNIHQFYVLPTQCIYVFVWIWEQTAIISLQHWLIGYYNRDEVCLLCGTDWMSKCNSVCLPKSNALSEPAYSLKGHDMPQEVGLRPPIVARSLERGQTVRGLWQTNCHSKSGLPQYFSYPLSGSFHQCSIFEYFHLHKALTGRTNGRRVVPFKKLIFFFGIQETPNTKYFHIFPTWSVKLQFSVTHVVTRSVCGAMSRHYFRRPMECPDRGKESRI